MKTAHAIYNLERFTDLLEEHKAHKRLWIFGQTMCFTSTRRSSMSLSRAASSFRMSENQCQESCPASDIVFIRIARYLLGRPCVQIDPTSLTATQAQDTQGYTPQNPPTPRTFFLDARISRPLP
eukprot:4521170-Amphidinium_carterae.1